MSACAHRDGGAHEGSALACQDHIDNDSDGRIDCLDADCVIYSVCGGQNGSDGGASHDLGITGVDLGTTVPNTCSDTLDVVFVLDVSSSMAADLGRIRSGMGDIWNAARALTSTAQFSMIVFVDDVLPVNHCAPFASLSDLQDAFDQWASFCSSDENPVSHATAMDCPENSLDALYAATACPWRTPSTRIVVHVTDDTFAEPPSALSTIPVQHSYADTVAALMAHQIRVGTFATPSGEATWWCSGDTTGQGFFEPWNGQAAIPVATGGRAWSINQTRNGTINMDQAITQLVTEEFCTLY